MHDMADRYGPCMSSRLIMEVEKHPILYDRTRRDYVRKDVKDDIWQAISDRLGITAADAQAKWRNIKDCMYKHYKKDRATNGQSASFTASYKHAHILGFLIDSFDKFSNMSNPDASGWEECSNNDGDTIVLQESYSVQALPTAASSGDIINGSSAEEGDWKPPAPTTWGTHTAGTETIVVSTPTPNPAKKRRITEQTVNVQELAAMAELMERSKPKESDGIDMFLGSMATIIRKLPTKARSQVKFSIHKIVHEAEMEHLFPDPPPPEPVVIANGHITE